MGKGEEKKPVGAGRSSFDLIDPDRVFGELHLEPGTRFLDIACGMGDYALAAAQIIGEEGRVYAVDLWEEGIATLKKLASAKGFKNIKAVLGDVSKWIPLENDSVDMGFIATALHDLVRIEAADGTLKEAARVLKPQGSLAVLEFKKIDGPPGPPIDIRLNPEDVQEMVVPYGFKNERMAEVGPYHYMIIFSQLRLT